jgi:hypothetical protein
VRSTDLRYAAPADEHDERLGSLLRAVSHTGYVRDADGGPYRSVTLPPVELGYTAAQPDGRVHQLTPDRLGDLPAGFADGTSQAVDLDADGSPGVLTPLEGAWYYRRTLGGGALTAPSPVDPVPLPGVARGGRPRPLDLAGDGRLDVAFLDGPAPGWFERDPDAGWSPFRPFDRLPNVDRDDLRLYLADLTGDGLADVLQLHDPDPRWFPSLGERGFDTAGGVQLDQHAPVGVDAAELVVLADMCGDGQVDLVRVRNGSVVYWPNEGYGRFGPAVVMEDAPWFDAPDLFNPARLRVADVDGGGAADLVYLHPAGPRVYLNRCGNGWTGARQLPALPAAIPQTTVDVVDLLGTGTACLVWSSPLPPDAGQPVRYVDLTGGVKPRMLSRITNNLGATTAITYAPSTLFSRADRAAGRPWRSLLPFPVHVVERTEMVDAVGGARQVSRYRYHDGHYDGPERAFHGFGLVERFDTDEFETSDTPPPLVRSWFHTGRSADADELLARRWRPPAPREAAADRVPSLALPDGLTPGEERQATRALKGRLLREEVFGLDDGPDQAVPYSVTDQSWAVRCLQPATRPGGYAVFLTHEAESVSRHHERQVPDPRVRHAITLEVDAFGTVLSTVGITYGRRCPDPRLTADEQAVQGRDLVTWTPTEVTGAVDTATAYRTPAVAGSSTFEVTGLPPAHGVLWRADQVRTALAGARQVGYHEEPAADAVRIRLVERMLTVYRRDDLTGPLPPGQLESLALRSRPTGWP